MTSPQFTIDPREAVRSAAPAAATPFDLAAEDAAIGLAVLDANGSLIHANPAFQQLLGIDGAAGTQDSLVSRLAASSTMTPAELAVLLADQAATTLYLRPPRGAPLLLHLSARRKVMRIAVLDAASNLPTTWLETRGADRIDPLTGLGNRRLFEEIAANWVPHGDGGPALAAVMVNLDGFKQVNESLGHDAGDELLKLVANRIRSVVRSFDAVIRLGGDDFLVVQTSVAQPAGAQALAERLVELLARPFLARGEQINVDVSVGIAIVGRGTESSDDLLKHADLALREAKAAGRGSYRSFEPELEQRARARREVEVHLRRALALKELSLFYQPQMRLRDKRICGFEALMRWHNPQRGWVSPAEFIPLAEKIGEIDAMGAWALRTACRDAMQWPGDYSVAVNVSPLQFASNDLVEAVRGALADSGLPAERLEVEITEGALLHNTEAALTRLAAIKDLGVSIAMDDFGTGYSSLGYLTRFPFSKIKIDQSFLRGEQSARSRALVHGILALGDSLGMTTIAEGVETEQQLADLGRHGCMLAQGFLIGRPLPFDAVTKFIAAHEAQLREHPYAIGK